MLAGWKCRHRRVAYEQLISLRLLATAKPSTALLLLSQDGWMDGWMDDAHTYPDHIKTIRAIRCHPVRRHPVRRHRREISDVIVES